MTGNPGGAAAFARILEEREETPELRAINLLTLAELELAQGRRTAARREFAKLTSFNPDWAIADESYRLLAWPYSITDAELQATREALVKWNPATITAMDTAGREPALTLTRHAGIHRHLRHYLLGRIEARLGQHDVALRRADELETLGNVREDGSVSKDLAQSIRAHVLVEQSRWNEALGAIELAPREVPFTRRVASWAFIQPQERFLRAELLSRLGRFEEALKWYESIHSWPESVLAGSSHLRQGELQERLGRRKEAIAHYRRFVELWRECDPEFRPLLESAAAAMRRLATD